MRSGRAVPAYPKLFEKGYIGRVEIKNRIVFAPISTNLASVNGEVSQRLIDHYYRVARGGAGLIIVENACVHFPLGRHGATQPRIDSDEFIPGLYHLAQAIHRAGAKACIELTHPGGVADPKIIKGRPIAPSAIPLREDGTIPRELSGEEIEELADSFGAAALRARRARFDMVEIQAGHGLLINQFLSPLTNRRRDEYGGSLEGRLRFPRMVVERVKEYAGEDFPVSVRLGVEEFREGGIRLEEGKIIAKKLVEAGADAIHVTLGRSGREKRLEPMPYPQGWRVYLAEEVKKVVDAPVITVGVIREPSFAEKILEEGRADFVALGRALLADPEWPRKAMMGEERAIRRCVSCNECVRARHYEGVPIRCTLNPEVELGGELARIKPAEVRRKVMIIGAGPAGLEAARVCALRGHEVHLYEREERIGGTLNIASTIPGKEKLRWIVDYYAYELPRLGVQIHLQRHVDRGEVERLKPDVVIVAAGASPVLPKIQGVGNPNVVVAHRVLRGEVDIRNRRVTVIGGGIMGLEAAEFLACRGNEVTVVRRYETILRKIEPLYASYLLERLRDLGVKIMSRVHVEEITSNSVVVRDQKGRRIEIPSDWVVIARGLQPNRAILHELEGYPTYLIGDCLRPRRIYHAILEGFITALQV